MGNLKSNKQILDKYGSWSLESRSNASVLQEIFWIPYAQKNKNALEYRLIQAKVEGVRSRDR